MTILKGVGIVKRPWENKKVLITMNVINLLFLIWTIILFLKTNDWKQAVIWGTIFIFSTGLNFMDLEKIKKRGE
jgi:hypothetical protein